MAFAGAGTNRRDELQTPAATCARRGGFRGAWGSCGITCAVGFGSCDGSNATGCEVELNGNPNCGACGVTCTAGLMCLAVSGWGRTSCQ